MIAGQPNIEPAGLGRLGDQGRVGPTVLRMVLGVQLRRRREAAGISREAAGDAIRASHAKISRLELGRVGCKVRDLNDLLTYYGVTDHQECEALRTLARQASSPGWWHRYGELLPSWFEVYIGLEQAASIIRTFQAQFVHGLLQTEAYTRDVVRLGNLTVEPDEVERRVALRMARQEFLDRPNAPNLWIVLDEAALRRAPGEPAVMRDQVQHLIDLSARRGITIQLLPFDRGGHVASGGSFTMLRFPEPDLPDLVYVEQLGSALYLDKRQDVDGYRTVMDRLCAQAASPTQTVAALTKIMQDF